jgi:hypothetical protein
MFSFKNLLNKDSKTEKRHLKYIAPSFLISKKLTQICWFVLYRRRRRRRQVDIVVLFFLIKYRYKWVISLHLRLLIPCERIKSVIVLFFLMKMMIE